MMKKLLLASTAATLVATAATAADLPRRAPPPPVFTPVPVFTWTGFYAGFESTYVFTDRQRITTAGISPVNIANVAAARRPAVTSITDDGFANIGGTAGFNYQFTPGSGFVVGIANSIDWTDLVKNRYVLGAPNAGGVAANPNAFRQSLDWLGTLTGRVGYAFDRVMVYGLGGLAYGNVFYDANFFTPGGALAFAGRYDDFQTGYAYGGGIEIAIPTDNFLNTFAVAKYLGLKYDALTIKAEYVHYDLGSRNVLVAAIPGVGTGAGYVSRFRTEGDLVRAGFNYKFGGF
ncbi:porin family protein [Methylobacterium sp. NEAU 140]|uniref:outer membrane protein n=1 Tax=Methylobacterium sp. NEAU 140 TaxID=3064945 RepID=UPI002734236D|nr:porin family protein [Methylobacterium sp. NEAU 140]MDP4024383.1 porin family protein [Methylobacterium sp. NEAU 140]